MESLAEGGFIDFPDVTKNEIWDRSKGDAIAKTLVVVQTGWFMIQCIARGVQHLPITELELTTLGFAVLNLATYAFWWNKPLNVQSPLRVLLKHADHEMVLETEFPEVASEEPPALVDKIGQFFSVILAPGGLTENGSISAFYAGRLEANESMIAFLVEATFAITFGVVHLIAWSYTFSSHEEKMIWRVSAIAISFLPLLFCLFALAARFLDIDDFYDLILVISMIIAAAM